jgi:hypothetical protein
MDKAVAFRPSANPHFFQPVLVVRIRGIRRACLDTQEGTAMSSPGYSTHQQTRQQLDELDSLLQRMLSLPTDAAGASPAPTQLPDVDAFAPLPPSLPGARVFPQPATPTGATAEPVVHAWRVEVPAPPLATPVETPPATDARFLPPSPLPTAPLPPAPYPYSLVFGQQQPSSPPPSAAVPPPPAGFVSPAPAAGIPAPQWQAPRDTATPGVPFLLLPLLVLNRVFDGLTYLLGPVGGWLRRPSGRNLIGWLGVLMILGAVAWGAVDWFGLTWPR